MKYLIYSLTLVLIYSLVFIVLRKISSVKITDNVVGFAKFLLCIGIVGFCILMSFAGFAFLANSKKVALFFALFSLSGIYFVLKFFCFKIEFNDSGFYYKDVFKRKTFIEYREVEKGYNLEGDATIYTKKGKVKISRMAFNSDVFVLKVKEKYKSIYSKELPAKKKFDIFGGHVVNPGEFIFFYIIMILLASFLVWFLIASKDNPTTTLFNTLVFSFVVCIIFLFPIFSIFVARNWWKLPGWFVNLFFKEGSLK